RVGFETAAAASFVDAATADNDEFFAFHQALRVNGGIAATDADGEELGDFFGDGEEAGHRFERAAAIIGVEPGDNDTLAEISELTADLDDAFAEKLRFVDADDFGARLDF